MSKDFIKSALQAAGVFPLVRTVYRRFSSGVRLQQRREVEFYAQVLKPNGLCFDVGANLGQRSEVFLKLGNRVIILEPNIKCRSTLDFLFARNEKAEIITSAVGRKSGVIEFYSHGTAATSSALPDWDRKVFGRDRGQVSQTVPMITLDDLVSRYGIPDFVKIDVEGFELEVLSGISQPLPLLSFEFHSDDMAKTRPCLTRLSSLGELSLRACSMDCDWLTPRTDNPDECLRIIEATQAKGDLFVWTV